MRLKNVPRIAWWAAFMVAYMMWTAWDVWGWEAAIHVGLTGGTFAAAWWTDVQNRKGGRHAHARSEEVP